MIFGASTPCKIIFIMPMIYAKDLTEECKSYANDVTGECKTYVKDVTGDRRSSDLFNLF
jgi:hypothetical protein